MLVQDLVEPGLAPRRNEEVVVVEKVRAADEGEGAVFQHERRDAQKLGAIIHGKEVQLLAGAEVSPPGLLPQGRDKDGIGDGAG